MSIFHKLFGTNKNKQKAIKQAPSKVPLTYEQVMAELEKHKRSCYIVETAEAPNEFSAHSKMGGYPFLRNTDDWPICPNCEKNMQLFLQLNLTELPERKDNGLVQLFYCINEEPLCESEMEAFFPFSKSVVARRIEATGESAQITPTIDNLFQERRISTWEKRDDYPHFEEYHELGLDIDLEDDVYEMMEEKGIGLPVEADKLFGWPYWVQSVEYPSDRSSGEQMELLFQISSEHNLPYMFGDAGIAHLTQSPTNKDELGFGWACH